MYKVSSELLERIVKALDRSTTSLMIQEHISSDMREDYQENNKIVKLIKDNYLLDGE